MPMANMPRKSSKAFTALGRTPERTLRLERTLKSQDGPLNHTTNATYPLKLSSPNQFAIKLLQCPGALSLDAQLPADDYELYLFSVEVKIAKWMGSW